MNYDYNALALDGYNSNSVYNTIGVCMGVDAPNIGAWYTVTPGLDDVILSQEVTQDIQEAYNIGGGRGNLQPNEQNLPQIVAPGPVVAQLVGISSSEHAGIGMIGLAA